MSELASTPTAAARSLPPIEDATDAHVTADPLPTVQINGVVWDQVIIGNTVYAVGEFTRARPAGSAPGQNETPRSNILAYNITTGALITTFAPTLDRVAKTITKSPDGSRLYVGGEFTVVNGVNRYRIAALDPATGALVPGFNAVVDYRVNAIVATSSTIYVGGAFSYAGPGATVARSRLAAFSASTGALLSWAPSANNYVLSMVMAPDGSKVVLGGSFTTINGTTMRGMAAVDPVTGALVPWAASNTFWWASPNGGMTTLETDGTSIFGGGYTAGRSGGNLEGVFSADPATGNINWVQDCHGDSYSAYPVNGYVYVASHAHYCGNVGGFNQSQTWADNQRHATSFTIDARGTVGRDPWGYSNFEGQKAPSQVNWYPQWQVGSYTGQNQAVWNANGNSQYVVYGGEFLSVDGADQQGLVRFAVKPIAPAKQGPRLDGTDFPINARSTSPGRARITFAANQDRDDSELNYRITRDGVTVYTTRVASTFWNRPSIGFTDTGLTPGQTYQYQVTASDDDGNFTASVPTPVTIASTGAPSSYADTILADTPRIHWRLNEAAGSSSVRDEVLFNNATVSSTNLGVAGALLNETSTAAAFTNASTSRVVGPQLLPGPDTFSMESWVRTSSLVGGRIMGFGSSATGNSGTVDRVLYLNGGRVEFEVTTPVEGAGPGLALQTRTIESPQLGLNNNQWHHIVATLGADGMHLYIDGVHVASRVDTMGGRAYYGYWRVGADSLSGMPNRPAGDYLVGQIDEAAVYYSVLSPTQVLNHYTASGRTATLPAPPADAYGQAIRNADPYLYYRLAETSGTTANDTGIRANTGDYVGTTTRNQAGLIAGNPAVQFGGGGFVAARNAAYAPQNYSEEVWFNTTTTTGGRLIGFGSSRTANSTTLDRTVHMRSDGKLVFSANAGADSITTSAAFNNGAWHHVVATQGADGMKLYVDGAVVGTNPSKIAASYTGYWRVGTDAVPSGATTGSFNGRLDEAAVYDRVLTPAEVVNHLQLGGGNVANVAPTASFTAGAQFLQISVDASASSDSDGTIASYAWTFGDGGTATGVTAGHTYATAGSYTVTLTVTDDDGAAAQTSQLLTVAAQPANVPPTAAFTSGTNGLVLSVDATTSSDSDGSITGYAWDFGDSTTGSGATTTHTYATPGTYTVTLTVTDDDGATGTVSHQVNAAAIVTVAADAFGRTVANGFGTADVGGAWSLLGNPANYSVAGGKGVMRMTAAGATTNAFLNTASGRDVTGTVDVAVDSSPTGNGVYLSLILRHAGTTDYRARVRAMPASSTLTLQRVVNGTYTTLGTVNLPGPALVGGDVIRIKFQAVGNGTTTLSAKAWKVSDAEPAAWQIAATDTTAALQVAGGVGIESFLSSSSTTVPVVATFDDLIVTSP